MFLFVLGIILLLAAVAGFVSIKYLQPWFVGAGAGALCSIVGIVLIVISTAIYVNYGQGGIVFVKFGDDLPPEHVIATDGEKGPQAYVLPEGWHFFYWPWLYTLESSPNMEVPPGSVGVVYAKDGEALPEGEVYAPEWESPQEMLDGQKFLTSGQGYRGPQLTVLPPGQYRYNPRLFEITVMPALTVEVGQAVGVKANAGERYVPGDGEEVEYVNGVPIVPRGYRGIWNEPLTPDQYYIHPEAYEIVRVRTINRIYSYTSSNRLSRSDRPEDDNSISVRTSDGFEFPVDVRVSVKISADDVPYVVARLSNPDDDPDGDGFDVLEEVVILPAIRAIFRNSAETRGALEYVASRSEIERSSTDLFSTALEEFRIETDGIFIADIGLSQTPKGVELLATQTDREIAEQEQETWAQKKLAEDARAETVRAAATADGNEQIVASEVAITVSENEGKAEAGRAEGRAQAISLEVQALGGVEQYVTLQVAERIVEQWSGELPAALVAGGGDAGLDDAVLSQLLRQITEAGY